MDEHEVIVELSSLGGRWELGRTEADLHLLDRLLRGVTECGVVEVWAHRRSEVTVLLPGGGRESETGYDGCTTALVLLPFWRRWGRRTAVRPDPVTTGPGGPGRRAYGRTCWRRTRITARGR